MLKITNLARFIIIGIIITTLSYFSYWGYQWVVYVLGVTFDVSTNYNFFDMLVGLIAMIASIPLFLGATIVWRESKGSTQWITIGAIGFMIKNVLEISSSVYALSLLEQVVYMDIQLAAENIGIQLFQAALWVFILIYFKKLSAASAVQSQ